MGFSWSIKLIFPRSVASGATCQPSYLSGFIICVAMNVQRYSVSMIGQRTVFKVLDLTNVVVDDDATWFRMFSTLSTKSMHKATAR